MFLVSLLCVGLVACASSTTVGRTASTAAPAPATVEPATTPVSVRSTTPATTASTDSRQPLPADLIGKHWVAESQITIAGPQPLPLGVEAGFEIDADGTLHVNTGCNTGTGKVTPIGTTELAITDLVTSDTVCTGAAARVEATLNANLDATVTWQVVADKLTIVPINITDVGLVLHLADSA
ncbi:MAG TPA: META domain-containing protein [Ilumatobacteraceae bacterium]|jgi:heat shock protein HslJ